MDCVFMMPSGSQASIDGLHAPLVDFGHLFAGDTVPDNDARILANLHGTA